VKSFKGDAPRAPIKRLDYQPPTWWIDHVDLDFRLDAGRTRVTGRLQVRRDAEIEAPLELSGAGLKTLRIEVDGRELGEHEYRIQGERLRIEGVPERATVLTEVEISPAANTALEGLYQSGNSLLTQCEAEGFRKITWFGDRPDIMASWRVRLEADRAQYPVLLSNGNRVDSGSLDGGRHFAVWDDPFRKPSYLFALVAGDLGCIEDSYRTASGRKVDLKIYSERDNLGRLDHAMASLKRAMAWDEQRFGLEYDLDVYHIVATHDFNMGAMENKSLNIFNSRYVLADPDTATDADYEAIEAVIAHEYFHNWTGNRVTCRDWFQLTLKEGLTVYRDQEFTADHHSRGVKRIHDVRNLMARQFPEDAGPMAHPVRPERYVEINNFYTATVYEKGAEVVRMYETLLGRDGFRRGLDLYFERHDGQAVTCDDFRAAMADANGADLDQFEHWYRQTGTPVVRVRQQFDADQGVLVLKLEQRLPEHKDNAGLGALHIPLRLGLLDRDGRSLEFAPGPDLAPDTEHRIELRERETELRISGLEGRPVVSLMRGFPAPVRLEIERNDDELACVLAHDPDPVARWLAGRELIGRVLREWIGAEGPVRGSSALAGLVEAWRNTLARAHDDPALASELLQLPTESEIAREYRPVPVEAIHAARTGLRRHLGQALADELRDAYRRWMPQQAWQFEAAQIAGRSLAHGARVLAIAAGDADAIASAVALCRETDNMTDRQATLSMLLMAGSDQASELLAEFEQRYRDNPLVMDKWFSLQAQVPAPETVEKVAELMSHAAFSMRNPNKVRALIGTFGTANPLAFHRADGAGYRLVGEVVRELDAINPQVAARLVAAFNRWPEYDQARQKLMREQLAAIRGVDGLSPDVAEIVTAALGQESKPPR